MGKKLENTNEFSVFLGLKHLVAFPILIQISVTLGVKYLYPHVHLTVTDS